MHYSTAILRYPNGRHGIAGTVPLALAYENDKGEWHTRTWDTEAEVKAALIAIGVPFFQLADCSWYPRPPATKADTRALHAFWYN